MKLYASKFMELVKETQTDADEFNPSSTQQLQQLLFAPFKRIKKKKEEPEEALQQLDLLSDNDNSGAEMDTEETYGEEAPKRKVVRTELDDFPEVRAFVLPNTKVKDCKCASTNK